MYKLWLGFLLTGSLILPLQATKGKFIQVFFPDGRAITAELAVTEEELQQGLMHREKIYPDQGMLFIFNHVNIHSFWMKNMKFPLDIIWLDKEKRIVHMECNLLPCVQVDCPSYSSPIPSLYVLEIQSGGVEKYGLKPGDKIDFILEKN